MSTEKFDGSIQYERFLYYIREKINTMTSTSRPNIFKYATKELSQDAMICWLIDWSKKKNIQKNKALHACGRGFVQALLGKHKTAMHEEIESAEIKQQDHSIDVLARINGKHVLLIEDKTQTGDHDRQLQRCYEAVRDKKTTLGEVDKGDIYPIYLKTGNQPLADVQRIERIEIEGAKKKYKVFQRSDFLAVLNDYHGSNPILTDFKAYLQEMEDDTYSFINWKKAERKSWSWGSWQGFYRRLEEALTLKERSVWWGWGYVSNPSGGFLGFWWHWIKLGGEDGLYLQLENDDAKLHFKVCVADKEKRYEMKDKWHKLIYEAGEGFVCRPKVMRVGHTMTVAQWKDWLAFDSSGKLDIYNTVEHLKSAEKVLEDAVKMAGSTEGPIQSNFS